MIRRLIVAAFGAALLAPTAHAGTWYVGLGYAYTQAKDSSIDTTEVATSYARGGEVRIGWEYDWYLGFEARFQKSYGQSGSVHSNLSTPSFGFFMTAPKSVSRWLYLTGGVSFITAKSNHEIVTTTQDPAKPTDPAATITTVTYERYPTLSKTTWFVGGGVRYCGEYLCPRAEIGYRGSEIGGFYAGVGLDFRIP